jgi:hypothetical protein
MTRWKWVLWLGLFASLFLAGCGGAAKDASAPSVAAGSAPMAESADRDGDGLLDATDAEAGAYSSARFEKATALPEGAVAQAAPSPAPPAAPGAPSPPPPAKADAPTSNRPQEPGTGVAERPSIASPMLIYTANLHLAVFEAKKAIEAAEKLARDSGGYLVKRTDRAITFRVPAGKFQDTLAQVVKLGDVLHREVTARDVTEEFFDVQTRLQNLEAVRARFEELLKRAQKVEEALAVERELERVAGQIELLKGRLKLLKELVAFSTITVEFQPRATDTVESVVKLPFPWLEQLGLGELLRL